MPLLDISCLLRSAGNPLPNHLPVAQLSIVQVTAVVFFQLRTFLQSKTGEGIMIQDSPDAIKNMKLGKEVVV